MKKRTIRENIKNKGGLRKIKSAPRHEIYLVLDNIRSMYNVGAIFRSAEGARVKKIYLCGITATPPREQIFKTSLGAVDWVDWEYEKSAKLIVQKLKQESVQIVALEQTDKSVNFKKAKYRFPLAIVVGHELKGVSSDVLKLCDLSVEIPMFGRANSLNVATATGIVLFEVVAKVNQLAHPVCKLTG
jgi:23S rRNA (guanosine2251-2'-O)-methyltransferase